MAGFIYAKHTGELDPVYGKFEMPIKAIIEEESDKYKDNEKLLNLLFNVEKSNQFAETVMGYTGFNEFEAVGEGQGAINDTAGITDPKTIRHIQFMKEFTITKEMMEDSKTGIAANGALRAREFVRAYYLTRLKLAENALINATNTSYIYNNAKLDLTTADNKALFSTDHAYIGKSKKLTGTQSNVFKITSTAASVEGKLEESLEAASVKFRNIRDENGEPMGYVANTIILPGNNPTLEFAMKRILGSEGRAADSTNAVNTQYGNWNFVILPHWEVANPKTDLSFMLMSTDANRSLSGNMFYDRVKLTITNWVDNHTGNYIWGGRCRMGVGFGSWKQIALVSSAVGTDL